MDNFDLYEWNQKRRLNEDRGEQMADKIIAQIRENVFKKLDDEELTSFRTRLAQAFDMSLNEGDGLWANINAKQKRGEKPSHGNSTAHKDAVKAGNRINKEK
ncbi:hypothetical protein N9F16_00745 [bacterium]|jgi:hypothetical protein|nr:hypothetical protein [bacterium]|tara:strand:- start:39 stop:344 length:306 start_codon:yes stop_codon:yes gene_type:complete